MRIIIIGSGVAGLTAGTALANAGHKVTIYEQYPSPGGVTAAVKADGYQWDLGQLVIEGLGPDEPLGQILFELGVAEKIQTRIEDREYVFPDFSIRKPEEFGGIKWRIDYLKSVFPEDADGLDRYWKDYLRFTRLMTNARKIDRTSGLAKLSSQVQLYLALLPFLPKMKWSAQRIMDDYFQSEKLQAVFISILADFFTPPTQFPGLGVFQLNPEAVYDKRMPKELAPGVEQLYHYSILGGISTLVDAMVARIEAQGGQVLCGSPVTQILLDDGHVSGVVVNGETYAADVVIASGGAKETFFGLVGEDQLPVEFVEKVRGQPLMDSIFMVHLGVDFDPSAYLQGPVTYFYGTYDIEGGVKEALDGIYHQGAQGFVVHVPTFHTPEMAPPNHHAMTIYTIGPDTLSEGSWSENKEADTDALIAYAEKYIPGLSEHIKTVQVLTPEDWRERTHLEHHAFGGIAPIQNTPRVPHQTPIDGLLFVGQQSESGGGVNAVIPAAYKVAKQIVEKSA